MHKQRLSLAQQGLWYLSQVDALTNASYNMVLAFVVEESLDIASLERALARVQARHPALRSTVADELGVPMLLVADADEAPAIVVQRQATELQALAEAQGATPFPMPQGPLLRVAAAMDAQAPDRALGLVFTFHHLLFDGESAGIFLAELADCFDAPAAGIEPRLAPAPAAEDDLAQLEQQMLASPLGRRRVSEIARRLAGIPDHLPLPRHGSPDEGRTTFPAAVHEFDIDAGLVGRVAALARTHRVSPAAIHLAAFEVVLWRYGGRPDFGISLPVSHRDSPRTARAIGYHTNLALVRSGLRAGAAVKEFLAEVHGSLLDVLDECDVPFPAVTKQLQQQGRSLNGPLMQLGFSHGALAHTTLRLGDARLRPFVVWPSQAKNELKIDVLESADGARCCLIHDRDGLDARLIARMAAHYVRTLRAFVEADAEATLASLPMLSAAELAHDARPGERALADPGATAHALFERCVAAHPKRVAAIFGDVEISYEELGVRANRWAHHLRDLGVGPNVLVGVCMERSPQLLVALWAVLKAGGAYLPLDAEYPSERLADMLRDASAPFVLTHSSLRNRLPPSSATLLCVDLLDDQVSRCPATDPPNRSRPSDLVYCIHTSGSTGRPKGALNTHRGFVNLVRWYFDDLLPGPQRLLLASSPSFDLTQKNLLGASMTGNLLIVPDGDALDVETIAAAVRAHRPTVVNCAPSACQALLGQAEGLERVVLGGEPIAPALTRSLHARGIRVVNSYGPTECSDVALAHAVDASWQGGDIALGSAIPGVRVHVLDDLLRPVPHGVVGQIHIAGDGVGRGYLGRPAQTAEKFLPDPLGTPGSRMYATGDYGCRDATGAIEFRGRMDGQLKIRGYRIELGEIEAVLGGHPQVREVAVAPYDAGDGRLALAAYVVARDGLRAAPPADELRSVAAGRLPAYMVPQAWVFLDALPLDPNGKIDRRGLPAPSNEPASDAAGHVAPQTESEAALERIFAEVLGVDAVGIHDDFFALGGHSLLATQIIGRIADRLSRKLTLRAFISAPTVALLAAELPGAAVIAPTAPIPARRQRAR